MYIIKSQWSEGAILIQTDAMDIVEPQGPECGKLSNLPQQTSSSILYTLRAPPRYWMATAMDKVEPKRPDSGGQVGIGSDYRRRSGTIVINESGTEKDNKIRTHERSKTNADHMLVVLPFRNAIRTEY